MLKKKHSIYILISHSYHSWNTIPMVNVDPIPAYTHIWGPGPQHLSALGDGEFRWDSFASLCGGTAESQVAGVDTGRKVCDSCYWDNWEDLRKNLQHTRATVNFSPRIFIGLRVNFLKPIHWSHLDIDPPFFEHLKTKYFFAGYRSRHSSSLIYPLLI